MKHEREQQRIMDERTIEFAIRKEKHRFDSRLVADVSTLVKTFGIEMVEVLIDFHTQAINHRVDKMSLGKAAPWHSGTIALNYLNDFKHLIIKLDDPIGHMIKKTSIALNHCEADYTIFCRACYLSFWKYYVEEYYDGLCIRYPV
ncbi:MAG: hypothetical protein NTY33_02695 [Candidatus Moranbacteria bacterium]|nr:hypothetical protein [Candidatus Moranbacteria bacterium]